MSCIALPTFLFRRLSGKSRHVDFPLEKPTRRFSVGKADTSILVEKGHSSGPNLNYYDLSWDPLTLENHLSCSVLYLYVFSHVVSSMIHLSNWYFLIEKNFRPEVFAFSTKHRHGRFFNEKSTCPLFGPKIDVSAFPTKNRRVGFSNEKSTCQLFQRKIDMSAFFTKPKILLKKKSCLKNTNNFLHLNFYFLCMFALF